MGNESNSNSNIDSSPHTMESDSEDNSPNRKNNTMETEQTKPKRKYTRRKQSAEPSGVGHSVSLQKSTGGSTVQQSRKKRERNERHKQELASKLGLVTEELPGPKPRKTRARREPDNASDDDDSEEENGIECENDFDSIISGMLPFLAARTNPVDIILNRITSAFVGYPVVAHLSKTSPTTQKLTIEIEI